MELLRCVEHIEGCLMLLARSLLSMAGRWTQEQRERSPVQLCAFQWVSSNASQNPKQIIRPKAGSIPQQPLLLQNLC